MMEIFGLQKSFVHSYSKLSTKAGYIFLFESEPVVDLENTSYAQLLTACEAVMHVSTVTSVDAKNIGIQYSAFIPKSATMKQPESALSVREPDNSLSNTLPKHLVYSPDSITLDNNDELIMNWYEASAYKVSGDFNAAAINVSLSQTTPVEYIFNSPVTVDCFVIKQTTPIRACKLEAFVAGEWVIIAASYTATTATAALRFAKVTATRFRYTQLFNGGISLSCAYFGLVDFVEADKREKLFNFTKGIFCPSLKNTLANVLLNCTTSTLDAVGYTPDTCPCMLIDVSNSDLNSDILLSSQDNTEPRFGIQVVGGYVI